MYIKHLNEQKGWENKSFQGNTERLTGKTRNPQQVTTTKYFKGNSIGKVASSSENSKAVKEIKNIFNARAF